MAQEFLIAESGGISMVGSWHHELFLTLCSDGTCSLRLRFQGDNNSFRPKGVRGIRTAHQLIAAINQMSEMSSVSDSIDFDKLFDLLTPLRPKITNDLLKLWMQGDESVEQPGKV